MQVENLIDFQSNTTSHYVEVPGAKPQDLDILGQFKANLEKLDELQLKMQFMLTEVSSIIKK